MGLDADFRRAGRQNAALVWLIALVAIVVGILLCAVAHAQAVDQCAMTPMPGSEMILRLRCAIQVLDAERMMLADQLTDAEVQKRLAEARAQKAENELEKIKSKQSKPKPAVRKHAVPSGG